MVAHPVVLRGARTRVATARPTLLQRTDQDFITAILDDLSVGLVGLENIEQTIATRRDVSGVLKLYQPVQRTFTLAMVEVACELFNAIAYPRLDPERIDSAGLVLRRLAVDANGQTLPGVYEGWQHAGKQQRGWTRFTDDREARRDPDPQRRPAVTLGLPELDRLTQALQPTALPLAEDVATLFVAPPPACEATGKTILYGLVPLTSSEHSETPPDQPQYNAQTVAQHLPAYFREGGRRSVPRAAETLTAADADDTRLQSFSVMLRQVAIEFNLFGDSATSVALFTELNTLTLPLPNGQNVSAGTFLTNAVRTLVARQADASVIMPQYWPEVDKARADRLLQQVQAALETRLRFVRPHEGRFDTPQRLYAVRAFVRVSREDGCPPEIIWSDYSEPFSIVPWYESGDVPPAQVALPDPFDKGFLQNLKPNVSFNMPESLFKLLQSIDPVSLLAGGTPSPGGGIGLGWICSFSIPIITICAFIVLNIFLKLFDIIFQWMLFIKICIPFPRRN